MNSLKQNRLFLVHFILHRNTKKAKKGEKRKLRLYVVASLDTNFPPCHPFRMTYNEYNTRNAHHGITSFSWFPSLRMIPRSFLRRRLRRTSRQAELISPAMERRSSSLPTSSCLNSIPCRRCSRLGTLIISSMN